MLYYPQKQREGKWEEVISSYIFKDFFIQNYSLLDLILCRSNHLRVVLFLPCIK